MVAAIISVTKIWERLYLGSLKDAEQLARSNPQRITTVVSLCREQNHHRAPKITYIQIPIPDSRPISAQSSRTLCSRWRSESGEAICWCIAWRARVGRQS